MEPTIFRGEKFRVEVGSFQPHVGDLVLFEHDGMLIVKRVLAVAGDVVEGRNARVFVNGKRIDEPYVQHIGKPEGPLQAFGPVRIPAGQLFVAGDNRDFSFDSRDPRFGLIHVSDVEGKPVEVMESPNPDRMHKKLR
jgi:signal peptidase I